MEYFYKMQRLNDDYKIVSKKNNNQTYTKLKSSSTIAIFKKKREDDRMWDFHKNF